MHNIRYGEILYSQAVATQNNLSLLETSRKYFAHALVLIDNPASSKVDINVARALWGLVKVCKLIKKSKDEDKNEEMLEIARSRLTKLYGANTTMKI